MLPITHLSRIAYTLSAHGFGPLIFELGVQELIRLLPNGKKWGKPRARTLGKRIRILFEELGPTFQKFGQVLSTQSDLLPDEILMELQKLTGKIPPMDPSERKKILKKEWGKKHPLLKNIAENPSAVASIGQIHRATSPDGRPLAVKIQHPGIEKIMTGDLDAMDWIAKTILKAKPSWRKYNIQGILKLFRRSLLAELDFVQELKSYQSMKRETGRLGIDVPSVYPEWSSSRTLVMDWVEGIPLTDLLNEAPSPLTRQAAQSILRLVLDQIFIRGHFHGDPHPGNFMVTRGGRLTMIDLGLTGKLTTKHRKALVQALRSVLSANASKMASALIDMSTIPPSSSQQRLVAALTPALEEIFLKIKTGGGLERCLQEVFRAAASHDIIVDVEYVLMLKSLLTIESLCRQLDPEIRVFAVARPIVLKGLLGWTNPFEVIRNRLLSRS